MSSIRELAKVLRRTPFHPQWLLGRRSPPAGFANAKGIVLDIGAADRWTKAHLSDDVDYIALDYPATGKEFYSAKPDVFADAARLPLRDASVDGVICLEVIEHLLNPDTALAEIERVLKPGGCAWISIPFMYPIHNEPYDFQRYTEYGLRREMDNARLQIVSLERSGHAILAAGVLMSLSIAGGVDVSRSVSKALLLMPALIMIFLVNVGAWFLSLFWPDWSNISTNYHLTLRKPEALETANNSRPSR